MEHHMRMQRLWLCTILAMFAGCTSSAENKPDDVPDEVPGEVEYDFSTLAFFVTPSLLPELQQAGAVVLDARDEAAFAAGHVPGAGNAPWNRFVDGELTGVLDGDLEETQAELRALGVRADRPVIVYGSWGDGWGEEGRLFWMLEYLGHADVHVVSGGYARWTAGSNAVETQASAPTPSAFTAQRREDLRATVDEVEAAAEAGNILIIDTRRAEEFAGETPYGAARGGHIPSATHLYWKDVFQKSGELRAPDDLRAVFDELGATDDTIIISYCTGGVRSGFMYMILRWLGYGQPQNYDGSWWEWAGDESLPVEQ
jgi:thiosulfate/3-mercaptopyruvate sulfurtransferase